MNPEKATTKKALELLGPDFDAADYKVICQFKSISIEENRRNYTLFCDQIGYWSIVFTIDVFNEIWYKLLLLTGQSSTGTLPKTLLFSFFLANSCGVYWCSLSQIWYIWPNFVDSGHIYLYVERLMFTIVVGEELRHRTQGQTLIPHVKNQKHWNLHISSLFDCTEKPCYLLDMFLRVV